MEDKLLERLKEKIQAVLLEVMQEHKQVALSGFNLPYFLMADTDRFKTISVSEVSRQYAEIFAANGLTDKDSFEGHCMQVNGQNKYWVSVIWEQQELPQYILKCLIDASDFPVEGYSYEIAWETGDTISTGDHFMKGLTAFAERLADGVIERRLHPPVIFYVYVKPLPGANQYFVHFLPPSG